MSGQKTKKTQKQIEEIDNKINNLYDRRNLALKISTKIETSEKVKKSIKAAIDLAPDKSTQTYTRLLFPRLQERAT